MCNERTNNAENIVNELKILYEIQLHRLAQLGIDRKNA